MHQFYFVVNAANTILRRANDWMRGNVLIKELSKLRTLAHIADEDWPGGIHLTQFFLTERLIFELEQRTVEGYANATELTRLSLVCDLISLDDAAIGALDEPSVFARLNQRSVILPDRMTGTLIEQSRVELIRDATVSDLHVIRREWACYVPGEIANIRNVMRGETFEQTQKQFRETETIDTTETERQEQMEQEDTSKLASELSQEVNSQLNLSVNGYFNASAQYNTPTATINISGGADASLSIQRGERFASKVAREAVTKAVRRIDTRTRATRSERELQRDEDITRYKLSNEDDNLHAVYRWVDRVDRYQLFRYPERLQLEFQLPEPAEFYRKRTEASATAAARVDAPPEEFDVTLGDITPENLLTLATEYRASNLPSLPDESINISRTLTVDLTKDGLPANDDTQWNSPSQSKELDIGIPTNYVATRATFSGHGYPIWGNWRVGSKTRAAEREGFHSGFAAVSVGNQTMVNWVGGYRKEQGALRFLASYGDITDKGSASTFQQTDQAGEDEVRSVPYGRATLVIGQDKPGDLQPDPSEPIDLNPGVAVSLKVGVSTSGLAGCIVTFLIQCKRTDEALLTWKLSVYDALFSAWSQWKKEYESAQLRRTLTGSNSNDAGSSQRNEQIIREELKRQVISWLLNEENFAGRPALLLNENTAKFHGIDFDKARATAPTIQFLEQAFEWGNMMYMFYPYYWADATSWKSLASVTANDAEFERFLRAGSARVVVPARPGFNDAVKNWLQFQIPFISGQLPAPNDNLFVAIDREIRDLTSPWEGGIAEDWWEARVSTTLLYLEEEGDLPIKNDTAVLPVAKNEVYAPKPICE